MKKIAFLFIMMFVFAIEGFSQVGIYVRDNDSYTNLRSKPSGSVVATAHDGDMFQVDRCEKGWFHIASIYYTDCDGEDAKLPRGNEYWIHSSVIGVTWVNDGNVNFTLYSTPSTSGKVVARGKGVSSSNWITRITDLKGSWVKVRLQNGKEGWVKSNLLCGNSLTTCA